MGIAYKWWLKQNEGQILFQVINGVPVITNKKQTNEKKMVKRQEKKEFVNLKSFEGICESVEKTSTTFEAVEGEKTVNQLKMVFGDVKKPVFDGDKFEVDKLYNFLNISAKTKNDSVCEGSNLESYLKEIEIVLEESQDSETYEEAFNLLVGKRVKYVNKKIGRDFGGHTGKSYYVPQLLLD